MSQTATTEGASSLSSVLSERGITKEDVGVFETNLDYYAHVGRVLGDLRLNLSEKTKKYISPYFMPYQQAYPFHEEDPWFRPSVQFGVDSKEMLLEVSRLLGGDGVKWISTGGEQMLVFIHEGFVIGVYRSDQTCEYVETGEMEEVEETVVVEEAVKKTVTVQRPKTKRVCPPLMAD